MFERYTEKARRVIFFARYEASQFGAPAIEPEHLLLGLMREDKTLTSRFLARAQASLEAIRKEIEGRAPLREKISTSVELPLAPETKRVLAFAHEESDRLQHRHIGTEHLLLGLLREERSMAAEILYERGLRLPAVREEVARASGIDPRAAQKKETPHLAEFSRDLTDDAANDKLDPLVGREGEIERVVQILCRRTKNNPVLIGEPGVGKTAIVEGLAQRIVRGEVPSFLENKRILSLDLSLIVAGTKYRGQFEERLKQIMRELVENPQYIVFIDELHTLVGAGLGRRLARRGEHLEAGPVARRDTVHRRDDARRSSASPSRKTARSNAASRPSRSRRRTRRRPCASSTACASATKRSTRCATRTKPSRPPSTSRTATSPTASCPTRPST